MTYTPLREQAEATLTRHLSEMNLTLAELEEVMRRGEDITDKHRVVYALAYDLGLAK